MIFGRKQDPFNPCGAKSPKTHDYTQRGWGHDYSVTRVEKEGRVLVAGGWGHGIKEGDYLVLPKGTETTRYQVRKIEYCLDPADMWFATLWFAPRPTAGVPA